MHRIVEFSLQNRFLIIVFALLLIGIGIYDMRRLPVDAVPDITPNQVLIITRAPGLGPVEVERFITFPVETAMSGLPGIQTIRSTSRNVWRSRAARHSRSTSRQFHVRITRESSLIPATRTGTSFSSTGSAPGAAPGPCPPTA